MSRSRLPNSFCTDPVEYSRPRSRVWKALDDGELDLQRGLRTARLQASAMDVLVAWAETLRLSQAALGAGSGLGRDRVGRLIRGEAWMRLDEAISLSDAIKVNLIASAHLIGDRLEMDWYPDRPKKVSYAVD